MKRFSIRALGVAALLAGVQNAMALPPAPKVEQMAAEQPKQPGVEITVLSPADLARCRVEPFPNAQNPVGYVLMDGTKPVRRFVAVNTANFNILSFYLDGEEVYRETDTTGKGKIDQYRWLGSNGSKTGRDLDGNGSIDVWETISPEEVSKELFEAIQTKDVNKLRALMPSEAELKSLGLPPGEIAKYQARMAKAGERFAAATSMGLTDKSKWIHAEFFVPQTTAADTFGGSQDLMIHRNGSVLYEKGDGKSADFFQTGELIRIGNAWRVIDGPAPGAAQPPMRGGSFTADEVPEKIKPLVAEVINAKTPEARAAILEKIVPMLDRDPAQEQWMRQLIEAHAAAAEAGEKANHDRLKAWTEQINKHAAKTPLAAFATFRTLSADYTVKLKTAAKPAEVSEVQSWWRESLESFVKEHPAADETPEALFRLAMAHEFNGKAGEETAVGHYTTLTKNFPQHPIAAQASGAARRLTSEGKEFAITGCQELATGKPYPGVAKDKVVLVYFWGSYAAQNGTLKADAAVLDGLIKKHGSKLEVVTICIDAANPQPAVQAINAVQLPGTHLVSPGNQLVTAWGIMGQHVFLLNKSGKVENKNATLSIVGDEIEKLVK